MKKTCGTCCHFQRWGKDWGFCERFPPAIVSSGVRPIFTAEGVCELPNDAVRYASQFPAIGDHRKCGEHKPIVTEPETTSGQVANLHLPWSSRAGVGLATIGEVEKFLRSHGFTPG